MRKIAILFSFIVLTVISLPAQEVSNDIVTAKDSLEEESSLVMKVISWYNGHLNYGTVTMLMALESSFIPFPSEMVVPPAAYHACNPSHTGLFVTESKLLNILLVILFATLGALIGAFINYYLAYFLGRPIIYWLADSKLGHLLLLNSDKIKKAENYFVLHGNSSTFIGRLVPGIRQLISIPAGLAKMKLSHFVLFTTLGAGIWNILLAILGFIAHGQQNLIEQYSHELSTILLVIGGLFVLYLVIQGYRKKRKAAKSNSSTISDSSTEE